MTAWMVFSVLCALGFACAALLAERVLVGRSPVRMIWVAAIVLSLLVPLVAHSLVRRGTAIEKPAFTEASVEQVDPTANEAAYHLGKDGPRPDRATSYWSALARFDSSAKITWSFLSFVLTLNFLGGLTTLRLMRRRWEERSLLGRRVFLSDSTGPAVVGVASPMIVVPRWVLELSRYQLGLMLRHEEEHRRAGDGRLLTLVELVLIAVPWNVALWWQVRRLRAAVELDCDGRVLAEFDARSYGDLLVEMARRGRGPRPMGATAFAERAVHLERRIRLLTRGSTERRRSAFALATCIGLAALSIAWVAPRPPAVEAGSAAQGRESTGTTPDEPFAEPSRAESGNSSMPEMAVQRPASGILAAVRVRARRDSLLLSLLTDQGARVTLASRLAPGPRGGGAASAGPRDGTTTPMGGARVGGAARPGGRGAASAEVTSDAILRRLFEGIELTEGQESQARSIIFQAQQDMNALRPPQPPE